MGPRRISTASNASGSWLLDEQCDAQRAGIWPIGPQFDPYWENVSLLLRMDGSNGSTTFADLSSNAHTITVGGNAQVSTTDSKFGTGSLLLDGAGDYLETPAHSSFAFGTGDFTVECWVYPNVISDNDGLFTIGSQLFAAIYQNNWAMGTTGSMLSPSYTSGAATAGSWQHFAITRSESALRLFINGTQLGPTRNDTTDLTNNQLFIGYYFSSGFAWNGKIDEFRVTKGIARYTSNSTPPTAPFPTPPAPPNPIPALSPVLWYDFADESTVGVLESGEIAQVTDKGSRGWTLTKSATGPYPYYVTGINGLKCLDWGISPDHDNFLYNSSGTPTSIGEVYVVVDAAFGGNATNFAGLLTRHNGVLDWYVLAAGQGLTQQSTYIDELFINGGTSNKFSAGLFGSPSIDNPAILCLKNSSGIAFVTDSGFQIGNDRNFSYLNRGWSGLIGEYVIFPSVLSPTDRDAVQAWLATKWGITLEGQGNG
jgi:hypothetical protein